MLPTVTPPAPSHPPRSVGPGGLRGRGTSTEHCPRTARGFGHPPERGHFGEPHGTCRHPPPPSPPPRSLPSHVPGQRCPGATRCPQVPTKSPSTSWHLGIWGHPLHVPPAPASSNKGEGTQGRQPLSGTGLRSLPRFPQAEIGREASGGGKQGWESSARLDKGAAEMGAKIFRQ